MYSISSYRKIVNRLNGHKNSIGCPKKSSNLKNKLLENDILLINKVGSDSENGEIIKSCISFKDTKLLDECKNDPNNIIIISKKIPLERQKNLQSVYKSYDKIYKYTNYNNSVWVELLCSSLAKEVILQKKICPNLPLYYKNYFCNNCSYESEKLKERIQTNEITKNCIISLNEYADYGDLNTWLKSDNRSFKDWQVMYFQVFAGLYVMQKFFNLQHYDLHWGNILVHSISKTKEYFIYNIDGIKYKIPNIGFRFTLNDFGYAIIPEKIQAHEDSYYDNLKYYNSDYFRIAHAIKWSKEEKLKSYNKSNYIELNQFFSYIKSQYNNNKPLSFIIKDYFKEFTTNENRTDYSITDKSKKQLASKIPDNLKWLLNNTNTKTCKTDQELGIKTNRCRKKCKSDQLRDKKTDRCIKIKCKQGQELNEKTNRCRKKCKSDQVRNKKTKKCIKIK